MKITDLKSSSTNKSMIKAQKQKVLDLLDQIVKEVNTIDENNPWAYADALMYMSARLEELRGTLK